MKKISNYVFTILSLLTLFSSLEAVSNAPSSPSSQATKGNLSTEEKYEMMQRDQIDNSNTLAIPFDESEIEDEEQINEDEKREVFSLPNKR